MSGSARVFQTCGETNPAVLGFIVLSGYCIHRNGFRRHDNDVQGYCIRRAFRIYPVYLLAIILGIECFSFCFSLSPGTTSALSGTTGLGLPFILLKLAGASAFLPHLHSGTYQGNAPLQTVMVEIWLYALYPIIVLGVLKRYREPVLWVMLALAWAAGMAFISYHSAYSSWWHNGSILGFVLYWWIGAKFTDPSFSRKASAYSPVLIIIWLSLTAILILGLTTSSYIIELRKLSIALLFGILATRFDRVNIGFGLNRIGKAGYSIYALHAPIVYTLLILDIPWQAVLLAAVLTGIAVYRIYEHPLLTMGKRLAIH